MAKATMYFPSDFLWGAVTAAYRVEGKNHNNDWWQWEQRNLNSHSATEDGNWWQNTEKVLDRAAKIGLNSLRMSIEWSRVEPEPSVFDDETLNRYRQIIQALQDREIEPMVALHHFSNPVWLVEKGDFERELVVDYFQRYAARVVDALGDLVSLWITINEPVLYVLYRYLKRRFPQPVESGWSAGMRAIGQLLSCHSAAFRTIKNRHPDSLVGVANQYRLIFPHSSGNLLHRWWARRVSWLFNELWMESMVSGRLRWPVGRRKIDDLAGAFDFIGLNYYSPVSVSFPTRPDDLYQVMPIPDPSVRRSSPEQLFRLIKSYHRFDKPIYITAMGGNNMALGLSEEANPDGNAYLLSHLRELWRTISFNFPVMGFYHQDLIEGIEWAQDGSRRNGLIASYPDIEQSNWPPSVQLYRDICHTNSIGSEMVAKYAPELSKRMFPGRAPGES